MPIGTHEDAKKRGALCDSCPLRDNPPVFGTRLSSKETLIICGEGPGHNEERQGEYFVGEAGHLLFNRLLSKFDIPRSRCFLANATLCRPPYGTSPAQMRKATACCKPRLVDELKQTPALTVLAYGGHSQFAFTGKAGIFDWMGSPMMGVGPFAHLQTLSTLHPAFVLRPDGRAYISILFIHTERAWQLAQGLLQPWQWPHIITEPGKEALKELTRIAKERPHIGFDVETRGKDPLTAAVMSLAIADTKAAVSLPWESYIARKGELVHGIDHYKEGPRIRHVVARILGDAQIPKVLQNGQHDILTAEHLGMPLLGYAFDDLLAHATVIQGVKHDLGVMASIEFPADRWKSAFHAGSDNKGLDNFVKRAPEDLRTYNAKDAAMTLLLEEPLRARIADVHNGQAIFDGLMERAKITIMMRRRGAPVDRTQFSEHRRKLGKNRGSAARDLMKLAELVGFSRPKHDQADWQAAWRALSHATHRCARYRKLLAEAPAEKLKPIRKRMLPWKRKKQAALLEWKRLLSTLPGPLYNPNSSACNSKLFFECLRVQAHKFSIKTNRPVLDEKMLTGLVTHANALVATAAKALLRFRRWSKMRATYIDGMLGLLDKNDIVHPTWNVTGARTGRFSCQDPNVQNIPKPIIGKRKDGTKYVQRAGLRNLFVGFELEEQENGQRFNPKKATHGRSKAKPGQALAKEGRAAPRQARICDNEGRGSTQERLKNWIVECDYDQLELRIVAQLANDKPLIELFAAGGDPHRANAADIFGVALADVSKSQRDFGKTFVYGADYGAAAETLWQNICVVFPDAGFTLLQIERLLITWFKKHPAIRAWQQKLLQDAARKDYVEAPISGKRLYFNGLVEPNKAINTPVQTTGADIINKAIGPISRELDWPREGILFQCHDSLVCDGPDPKRLIALMLKYMNMNIELNGVPMNYTAAAKIGRNWGACVDVTKDTDIDALMKKLLKEEEDAREKRAEKARAAGSGTKTIAQHHCKIHHA